MSDEQIPEADLTPVPYWLAGENWAWAPYPAFIGADDADGVSGLADKLPELTDNLTAINA